jgi:glucosamine--fructose-6-phosphate aminotransferase (isomerizing)
MAKEIFEQPTVLAQCLAHYVRDGEVQLPDVEVDFAGTDRLIMVACGTAHYACLVAKYWFEQLAGLPCDVDIASEFRYREPPSRPSHRALRQPVGGNRRHAGRAALCAGKAKTVVSLVNVPQSSIARESDIALPILAGVEIGVASTKAFMNQLGALACLAIVAGRQRGPPDARAGGGACQDAPRLPAMINQALALEDQIRHQTGNWPRRARSCSSAAGRCSRWRWKAR